MSSATRDPLESYGLKGEIVASVKTTIKDIKVLTGSQCEQLVVVKGETAALFRNIELASRRVWAVTAIVICLVVSYMC
jgi:hypothetical protein